MQRVIGLIDGSVYAQSVCDHIAWIAGKASAKVEIIHVIGRRDTASEPVNLSGNIGLGARTALLEELSELDAQKAKVAHARGRLLLEEAKSRLQANGVESVDTRLRNGDLVENILDFEAETDIFVIGKRGEGADFAKGHLGSNLERLIRSTRKPVLVASRTFKPIGKMLIAFDGSPVSLKTVDQIARNAMFNDLEVCLTMAGHDDKDHRRKLDDAAVLLKSAGLNPETRLVEGQAEKVITEAIKDGGFDLLAMGAYSHSRLRNLFIGSTTTEMIRSCTIPVVIFR